MVWYKVGSADETPGKSGLAHFLEHLMFKGTAKNPVGRFSQIVATIGGQENAFTSADYTGYFQRVPRDQLKSMMEFEADRMTGLVLTDEAVRPELKVVLEEQNMRVANNPARAAWRADGGRTLSQSSLWQTGDRLAARDRAARPRRCARLLPALLYAEQCDPGRRRRRHRATTCARLAKPPTARCRALPRSSLRMRPQEPVQEAPRTVTLADPARHAAKRAAATISCLRAPRHDRAKARRWKCSRMFWAAARAAGYITRWSSSRGIAVDAGASYDSTARRSHPVQLLCDRQSPASRSQQIEQAMDAVIDRDHRQRRQRRRA